MKMFPEGDGWPPGTAPDGAVPGGPATRRLVAVAVSAVDVLHPDSDLRHVAGAATEVDVLVARVDRPGTLRRPLPVDAPDYPEDGPADPVDELLAGFTVPLDVRGRHRPDAGLPTGLRLHRLDLRWRVQHSDEQDLVAALSELIGFDPDDQVFCVAPVTGPDPVADPEMAVVKRVVQRVARVYGLPVLHYRRVGETGPVVAPPVYPQPA